MPEIYSVHFRASVKSVFTDDWNVANPGLVVSMLIGHIPLGTDYLFRYGHICRYGAFQLNFGPCVFPEDGFLVVEKSYS